MPESIGQFFPTQVPSYTEAADIRKAFNLYHYGTEEIPSTEEAILSSSMAGYIRDTLQAVQDADIGATVVIALTSTDDLNLLVTSGSYKSTAIPDLESLHYPSTSPGILNFWITADSTYFQTYLSVVDNGSWWRVGTKPQATVIWSEWSKAALENHTHDGRYYTISQINSKLSATTVANTVGIYDDSTPAKLTSSAITVAELNYLDNVTGNIQEQLNLKSATTHNHNTLYYQKSETAKVTVSSTQPSSPAINDLWFY
jgi:hypothetical protein